MKSFLVLIGIALVAAAGFVGGLAYRAHRDSAGKGIVTQKPKRRILYYVDPMHPVYKSDKPGIAPDCGMKLEPVYADSAVPEPTDTGLLNISPDQQRLIGVEYGQAELTTSSNPFRASGKVALDETRLVRVHPKVEGWIEKVFVDFTGAPVEKGQPLLTIYSPDMLAAEQDYLLALQARKILRSSPLAEAAENSDSLLKASRTRLELWDLSPAQLDEIDRTGNTIHAITLYAPAGGFVTARNAIFDVPGFRIEFVFAENDFFTDTVLRKSYFYQQQAGYGGDFIYDHAEGCDINWNEGKDLTVKVETKRQRNKSTFPLLLFLTW